MIQRLVLLYVGSLTAIGSSGASAQTQPSTTQPPDTSETTGHPAGPQPTAPAQLGDGGGVQDIIVTAQKRSESIQRVPIAITAVDGDTLSRSGITGTDAIQKLAPGLNISTIGSGFVSYTYIRGGGTNQVDIGADPSVAYFIDEIYIGGTAGLALDLFDIDRVEVLKGPQGTLFGRNAASGAISIVTKRPSTTFSGYASVEAGNYGSIVARAGVTGPLAGDSLFYRFSVGSKHHDAYVENLNGGEDPGRLSSLAGRGQIEWRGSNARLLITADAMRGRNGQTAQFLATSLKTSLLTPSAAATLPLPRESFYRQSYRPGFENQDVRSLSGRLEWSMPVGELTSISAYRDSRFDRSQDYTPGADALRIDTEEHSRTFSQEVRIASDVNQRLRWLLGAFYYHANQTRFDAQFLGSTFAAPAARNTVRADDARLVTTSYAAFGQLSFEIIDDLTLIAGLRYTQDQKRNDRDVSTTPRTATSDFTLSVRDKWDAFTPAFTLQYNVSAASMLYGSYRRGFKSGGFQSSPLASPEIGMRPFNPEYVDSYEIGVKSSLLNRRLVVNADLFVSKIRDQQILQTVLGTAGPINLVSNAGATAAKGLDISVKARPISAFRFGVDVTYQRARFDKYSTLVVGVPASFAGNTQLRSPRFTGAINADYDIGLANAATITVSGQYSYRTKQFYTPANLLTAGLYQPGYSLADAQAVFRPSGGDWDIAAWVRNIGGTKYFRNIVVVGTTGLGVTGDPTTFGGTLNVRF